MLALNSVEKIAKKEGCEKISLNKKSSVISFHKFIEGTGAVRINVYWTTGTVGTCINHPRQGKTQLFRRDIDLDKLREIFRNPRVHTGNGYFKKDPTNESTKDLEQEAKLQLKLLDRELESIIRERKKVQGILTTLEEDRKREDKAKSKRKRKREDEKDEAEVKRLAEERRVEKEKERNLEQERKDRGIYIMSNIHESKHVSKCFDKDVISIACGGRATIILYEDGRNAWTSNLTKKVHNKLNGRQATLPQATYVALGSRDRYYIEFKDGESEWVGCDSMTKLLEKDHRDVKSVAFGKEWDSYMVVFKDGSYSGKDLPLNLKKLLKQRKEKDDLKCVSLGPNGEYYLRADNGRAWWGGLTSKNSSMVDEKNKKIKFIDFGDNNHFIARYTY